MNNVNTKYGLLKWVVCVFYIFAFISGGMANAADTDAPKLKELFESESNQKAETTATTQKQAGPQDKYNRTTPQSSFRGLSAALDARDYELALQYMDLRKLPSTTSLKNGELTRELKIIFDRSPWINDEVLSEDNAGHKNDSLPSYRDLLTSLETPGGNVDIYMQRVPAGKGIYIYPTRYGFG